MTELLFHGARNIPNKFANRHALIHLFLHVESLGDPEPDNIFHEESTPTAALLTTKNSASNTRTWRTVFRESTADIY